MTKKTPNTIILELLREAGIDPRNVLTRDDQDVRIKKQQEPDGTTRTALRWDGIARLTDEQVRTATERYLANAQFELDNNTKTP